MLFYAQNEKNSKHWKCNSNIFDTQNGLKYFESMTIEVALVSYVKLPVQLTHCQHGTQTHHSPDVTSPRYYDNINNIL